MKHKTKFVGTLDSSADKFGIYYGIARGIIPRENFLNSIF